MNVPSKLALGTVQFGLDYGVANVTGQIQNNQAGEILSRASDYGMDTLDTAIAYGNSEMVLGAHCMQSWKVVSKLPPVPNSCSDVHEWVKEQTLSSLKRLGIKKLYGLLLHCPTQLHENVGPSLHEALLGLKADGLVNKIGVSVYETQELAEIFAKYNYDLIQAPFNILNRSLVTSGWAKHLSNAGVEIHTRSAFLQGLLLIPPEKRPSKFNLWANFWEEWDNWLLSTDLTATEACLRFVRGTEYIDRVVIGVDTISQLDQLFEGSDQPLLCIPEFKSFSDKRIINPGSWGEL